jgi:hypothetical protein
MEVEKVLAASQPADEINYNSGIRVCQIPQYKYRKSSGQNIYGLTPAAVQVNL